jgi:hypothetical protein
MKNTIDKLKKVYSKLEHDDTAIAQALCTLIGDMQIVGDTQFDYNIDDETIVIVQYNKIIVAELNKDTDFFEDTLVIEVK